jgi:hypothetical protein
MNYPSEHLINSIEEIANTRDSLSMGDRSLTSAKGLHVQKRSLPSGELLYMAGGRLAAKLIFIKEADGTKSIKKYQPGGWEFRVEETLELCRTLKRASEELKGWPAEKKRVYELGETVDTELVNRVAEINKEHYEENNRQWRVGGLPRWIELRDKFFDELKEEWPIEYAELQASPKGKKYIAELLQESIAKAYITGYMYGRDWVTAEELTNATLYLGDMVARKVRHGFKEAKSRGIAFADVLAHLAAIGTVDTEVAEKRVTSKTGEEGTGVAGEQEEEDNGVVEGEYTSIAEEPGEEVEIARSEEEEDNAETEGVEPEDKPEE